MGKISGMFEAAPTGKVTLVASQRCDLHGYWESAFDITVA